MRKLFDKIHDRLKEINFDENTLCKEYWIKIKHLDANYDHNKAMLFFKDKIEWLIGQNVITPSEIRKCGTLLEFQEFDIFFTGKHQVKDSQAVLFNKAEVMVTGHSRVICFDKSKADLNDTSFGKAYNDSEITAKGCILVGFDNSKLTSTGECIIDAFDNCEVISTQKDLIR